jgi:hypothetical protein
MEVSLFIADARHVHVCNAVRKGELRPIFPFVLRYVAAIRFELERVLHVDACDLIIRLVFGDRS